MINRTLLASVAALVVFGGCTPEPHYERPAAPVASTFTTLGSDTPTVDGAPAAALGWHEFFCDPDLQRLIQIALENNRDLRVAALNVAEYEAQYRIARAALGPTIDASGVATRERSLGAAANTSDLNVGTTSWEIDFFGRLRSLKHQALENYLATDASRESTRISLIATVATDYLTWRSDQHLLQITQDTVVADTATYNTTRQIQELGNASMLDVREAQNSQASARASLAAYRRTVEQDRNNLTAVLGAALPADLAEPADFAQAASLAPIGAGLPSTLLTRRPDIVEAEHALKAANANIGAARAAFFPKIELTASAGASSSALADLFKAGSGAWTFAPSITMPIFDYGSNQASLDVAKIERQIEVADYEEAIQTAFKEVSNALTARTIYVDQVSADRDYAQSAQSYYRLAQARYRTGTDSFLTLLDAQRTLYTAQQQLATDELAGQVNLVTLYKALGGGVDGYIKQ